MLDFIQFINDNWSATAQKKIELLDDFCERFQYRDQLPDGDGGLIDNPQTKKEFANERIVYFITSSINSVRKRRAEEEAAFTELILE